MGRRFRGQFLLAAALAVAFSNYVEQVGIRLKIACKLCFPRKLKSRVNSFSVEFPEHLVNALMQSCGVMPTMKLAQN